VKLKHPILKGKIVHRTLGWLSGRFKSTSPPSEANQQAEIPPMVFEELEPRTLFSADPVSGLLNSPEVIEQQVEYISVETLVVDNEIFDPTTGTDFHR
jgi:hypothetical protein